MAMAPSRGGLPFNRSPKFDPTPSGAALDELSANRCTSSEAFGAETSAKELPARRPVMEEDVHGSGTARVNSSSSASTSGRQRTIHSETEFAGVRRAGHDNAAEPSLPLVDDALKFAGKGLGSSSAVTWGESLKYAAYSWFLGFWEALTLHRTVRILARSRPVLVRTAQCSLLNGFFFLGSILLLQGFLDPSLRYLLQVPHATGDSLSLTGAPGSLGGLHSFLLVLYNMLWLYPIYVISFIINCMWHQDIAKRAYTALQGDHSLAAALGVEPRDLAKPSPPAGSKQGGSGSGMESLVTMIGEEVYRVIMFAVFVAQVYAVSIIPYVGPALNFLLLAWLYAYYCYDYKWSSAGWTLDERLGFFETHWAFFAGFGTPCTIATFFLPFFASAAVWALVFPLFVLVATTSNPVRVVSKSWAADPVAVQKAQAWRVPIFRFAAVQSVVLLKFLLPSSREQQSARS